jgi:hypothetical protein
MNFLLFLSVTRTLPKVNWCNSSVCCTFRGNQTPAERPRRRHLMLFTYHGRLSASIWTLSAYGRHSMALKEPIISEFEFHYAPSRPYSPRTSYVTISMNSSSVLGSTSALFRKRLAHGLLQTNLFRPRLASRQATDPTGPQAESDPHFSITPSLNVQKSHLPKKFHDRMLCHSLI